MPMNLSSFIFPVFKRLLTVIITWNVCSYPLSLQSPLVIFYFLIKLWNLLFLDRNPFILWYFLMDKRNYIMLSHTILTFEKSWLRCPLISGLWGTFLCCLLKVLPFIYKFFSPHGTDFWRGRNQSNFILTPHGYPINPTLEFILPFWPVELFATNHISTWSVSRFSSMFHWFKRSWN